MKIRVLSFLLASCVAGHTMDNKSILDEQLSSSSFNGIVEITYGKADDGIAEQLGGVLAVRCDITEINLESNKITDEGIRYLADGLKGNHSVKSLNLRLNHYTSLGVEYLAQALINNTTLTYLNLGTHYTRPSFIKEMEERISQMFGGLAITTPIKCNDPKFGTPGLKMLMEALKENTTLTSLDLEAQAIDDEGADIIIEYLKTNKSLKSLNLAWNSFSLEKIKNLAYTLYQDNTTLEFLDLRSESYSDESLENLCGRLEIYKAYHKMPYHITIALKENYYRTYDTANVTFTSSEEGNTSNESSSN